MKMCCLKGEMSAPKRSIDSKAWCPLSFLLEILSPEWEYETKTRRIARDERIIRKVKH